MKAPIAVVVLAVLLAGCTSLEIPDYASVDMHDERVTGTLYAWVEPGEGFVTIYGLFEDTGQDLVKVDVRDPYDAWRISVFDENGTQLIVDDRATCRFPYSELRGPGLHEEFRFTWTFEHHDSYADCGRGESVPSMPVEPGRYTAVVQFRLVDYPADAFEARLSVVVLDN